MTAKISIPPLFVLALIAALPLAAQQPPQIHKNVSEVVVDLVVTDNHGKLITNLTPNDLEISDNGQAQKISSFRLVTRSVDISPADLERAGIPLSMRPQPFNIVVFVYDRIDASGRQLAKSSSDWFAQHELGPDDYAAVFRVDHVLYALSPLTKDKTLLEKAIAVATGGTAQQYRETALSAQAEANLAQQDQAQALSEAQQMEMAGGVPSPNGPGMPAGAMTDAIFSQIIADTLQRSAAMAGENTGWQSLTALRSLVDALSRLPGRKEILYYTQNLDVDSNTIFVLRGLIQDANRNHVSFYAVDPSGLALKSNASEIASTMQQATSTAMQQTASAGRGQITQAEANLGESEENVSYSGRLTNMNELALSTGGFLAARTNDLKDFMARIGDEVADHYELTYVPASASASAYHAITVKVIGHPHWIVRARKGYYALPETAVPVRSYEVPLLAQLQVDPAPHQLAAESGAFAYVAGALPMVRLETRVPLGDLAAPAATEAEARQDASFRGKDLVRYTVMQVVRDPDGRILEDFSRPFGFSVPQGDLARFRQAQAPPLISTFHLPAGNYTLQTVVYQAQPEATTVLTAPLRIPAAGPVRLSSVAVVAGVTKRNDKTAGYDPFAYQGREIVPNLTGQLYASAEPARTVGFYFIAYVPKGTSGATVTMSFAENGQPKIATPPAPLPAPDAEGRIPYLANIPLRVFPPGNYEVTVTVHAPAGSASASAPFTTAPQP